MSFLVKKTMSLWTRSLACLTFALALLATVSTTTNGADVFFADQLWSGDGTVLKDAAVLVVDGKVVAVGPRGTIEVPSGAILHELGTVSLVPGLVMAETTFSERGRDEEESVAQRELRVDRYARFVVRRPISKNRTPERAYALTVEGIVIGTNGHAYSVRRAFRVSAS